MSSNTREPAVVRVSQKGQATIPKPLREKFGIDTPGEVFIYEDGERIIVEPVPSLAELGGIHADDDCDRGEMIETVRAHKRKERERDQERVDRLRSTATDNE